MIVTLSKLVQVAPSEIVQRRTALSLTLVTVLMLDAGVAIVAVPEIRVHAPVSVTAGAFAARVKLPLLHFSWSGPALEAVTPGLLNVTTTSSLLGVHTPLLMVHRKV